MNTFKLTEHELTVSEIHRNLPVGALYEHAIHYEKDASIADNGALVAYSGAKTGRSPKDKRVVKNAGRKLSDLFKENFKKYEAGASAEVKAAGPA